MLVTATSIMALARITKTMKIFKPGICLNMDRSRTFFSRASLPQAAKNSDNLNKGTIRPKECTNRIMTIPNILTSTRILLTPAIGYYIWNGMNTEALYFFTVAALTDLLDGYVARKFNQGSHLGSILDPIADKFLMTTSFLAMYHVDVIPAWLVGAFIGRDFLLLSGGAVLRYISFQGKRPSLKVYIDFDKYPMPGFRPTFISKCNTALQIYLILLHLGALELVNMQPDPLNVLAYHIITACTTSISFGQYLSRQIFSDKTKYTLQ